MHPRKYLLTALFAAGIGSSAPAQVPAARPPTPPEDTACGNGPTEPGETPSLPPNMIGYFPFRFANLTETLPVTVLFADPRLPRPAAAFSATQTVRVSVPIADSGAFQIADNESPRPQDRVFGTFGSYSGIPTAVRPGAPGLGFNPALTSLGGFGAPAAVGNLPGFGTNVATAFAGSQSASPTVYDGYVRGLLASGSPSRPANPTPAVTALVGQIQNRVGSKSATAVPTGAADLAAFDGVSLGPNAYSVQGSPFVAGNGQSLAASHLQQYRETFGFEKAFLDGDASFGMRAPTFQIQGDGSFSNRDFGDLTFLGKYAAVNDRETGTVLSVGLAVTAPTGPAVPLASGPLHSTLFQPFLGYIKVFDRTYVQGFTSVAAPTDSRDVTIFFKSIAVGYFAYRNPTALLSSVTPTFELHVATPLTHRDPAAAEVYLPDLVAVTAGSHFGLGRRSLLTLGASTPVTGPRLYQTEAIALLNVSY